MDEPISLLGNIKTAAITNGNSVKASITQTVTTFSGSTDSMKAMVTGQVADIKAKYQEPAKTYDGYRYH